MSLKEIKAMCKEQEGCGECPAYYKYPHEDFGGICELSYRPAMWDLTRLAKLNPRRQGG